MEEATPICAYDRALCRAVWQRVAPEQPAFPPAEKSVPELTLPGAVADPCCMGTEAAASLAVLQGFVREALGAAQLYVCAAHRFRGETQRALRAAAEDEKRHARDLAAAIYLVTGEPYCPRVCVEQPDTRDPCVLLRRLYHEEACGGFNYARAAEETLDPCLAKLFAAISADEYRHAETLLRLLGKRLAL